jgi:hypothetical protein
MYEKYNVFNIIYNTVYSLYVISHIYIYIRLKNIKKKKHQIWFIFKSTLMKIFRDDLHFTLSVSTTEVLRGIVEILYLGSILKY